MTWSWVSVQTHDQAMAVGCRNSQLGRGALETHSAVHNQVVAVGLETYNNGHGSLSYNHLE